MTKDTKRTLREVGATVGVIAAATMVGVYLANPPKTIRLKWDNAPGAAITDVWGTTNLADWYHVGTVTNTNTIVIPVTKPYEFYRVSHPNRVGHYWDFDQYRYNSNVFR